MKLLLITFTLLLLVVRVSAQVTTNGFQTSTFANLGSVADSKVRYCTDCQATNPCTGSGTGAYAYRIGGAWVCNNATGSGSGGAPTNATYITQTANSSLTNEQALSLLSTGLMRNETSTGVVTTINTSAGVAANISDETGSGSLVFGTSPTVTNGTFVTPSVTTSVTLNGAVSVSSGSAGDFTISPTGSILVNPSGNQINPTTNYDINLGSNQKKFLSLSAAELLVETLVAQQTIGTIGGRILVGPTTPLIADLTNVATTFDVKYNNLANGDRVYMETPGQVEFMAVASGATPISGGFRYSITRNLDGSGANAWTAGDAVFNTGTTSDGFIDMYSDSGIAAGVGPTLVGNVRNSATYNDWTPTWAIGNLDGLYGYSGSTYGVAFGKHAASNSQILIDSTNGIRIRNGLSTILGSWDTSGSIIVGQVGSGQDNIQITSGALNIRNNTTNKISLSSAGVITIGEVGASQNNVLISSGAIGIRNNTTERIGMTAAGILTIKDSGGAAVITLDASAGAEITKKLTMPGASSAIAIGSTPPTAANSGTGIWIDRTGIYGVLSGTQQAIFNGTTGAITAGAGAVTLDVSGITLVSGAATANKIKYTNSGTLIGNLFASYGAPVASVVLESYAMAIGAEDSIVTLNARDNFGGVSTTTLSLLQTGVSSSPADSGYGVLYGSGSTFIGLNIGASSQPTAPLQVSGNTIRLTTAKTPASAAAACNQGDIVWDSGFVYVCVSTNTWKRVAIATW
jgi:hypothetical protein